jgi:hypothetical protein
LLAGDILMIPIELIEAFKVLAQSTDDLARYCPLGDENLLYRRTDENGFFDDVWLPSKAAAMACESIIHGVFHPIEDDTVRQIASEIQALILIMLELPSQYQWSISKRESFLEGPNDASWKVLRRLASLALTAIGSEIKPPQNSFGEFVKLGNFSLWRIVPASGDQGQERGER